MYMNELVVRVDPKHRPLHQFFKEELSDPLGKPNNVWCDVKYKLLEKKVNQNVVKVQAYTKEFFALARSQHNLRT